MSTEGWRLKSASKDGLASLNKSFRCTGQISPRFMVGQIWAVVDATSIAARLAKSHRVGFVTTGWVLESNSIALLLRRVSQLFRRVTPGIVVVAIGPPKGVIQIAGEAEARLAGVRVLGSSIRADFMRAIPRLPPDRPFVPNSINHVAERGPIKRDAIVIPPPVIGRRVEAVHRGAQHLVHRPPVAHAGERALHVVDG